MISFERATEIANLYYNDIYHLCLSRLKKEENAADVTQEVFLLFQEKYEGLEDEYIKAWLYKVANNKIKEQFRAIAKREKELELFEMVYTKHMEYKELAKAFDISEHAVRARVYRLRLKIKEKAAFIFMAILLLFMRF